jgi:hypothetical protein
MIQTSFGVWMKKIGSAGDSIWPGTPPGQQRACEVNARWPSSTSLLYLRMMPFAQVREVRVLASLMRSITPRWFPRASG